MKIAAKGEYEVIDFVALDDVFRGCLVTALGIDFEVLDTIAGFLTELMEVAGKREMGHETSDSLKKLSSKHGGQQSANSVTAVCPGSQTILPAWMTTADEKRDS